MLQVSFNFDPATNKVSNVTVTDSSSPTPAKKTVKARPATGTPSNITLNGSSLKLNQDVLDQLQVEQGGRICVRFVDNNVVLARPDIVGEANGGNLITKSLTVSCRGKASEQIAALGDSFTYKLESDGWMILSSGNEPTTQDQEQVQDEQEVAIPTEEEVEEIATALDESDFTMDLKDGEEIDFVFNI